MRLRQQRVAFIVVIIVRVVWSVIVVVVAVMRLDPRRRPMDIHGRHDR